MEGKQLQQPATVNQIQQERPNIPRTQATLYGKIANSMNGGHNRTVTYKKIMAGEEHEEARIKLNIQTLTPLTPAYQKLKYTLRTYFVPNSRVWDNAEKYTAQKGGSGSAKITEIPNLGGKTMPNVIHVTEDGSENIYIPFNSTDRWRDHFVSSYIPRMGLAKTYTTENEFVLPHISILPLRGRVAIYNDFERNKDYDAEATEYHGDTVTEDEWEDYLGTTYTIASATKNGDYYSMRARKQNSYWADYRTTFQGFEAIAPDVSDETTKLYNMVKWADWENKIAEARAQSENSQKNDWDIIAEIRGSTKLTEGKVQLIGKKTFNLNYSAITQNAYNNNDNIEEEFQVMGKQGAYSYTDIEVPIYAGMKFREEGYIHVIATVTCDTVIESAIDRNELNITPLDEYRPDLKEEKFDTLYYAEFGMLQTSSWSNYVGYKRKFSEYFKLPNIIAGDMSSLPYYQTSDDGTTFTTNTTLPKDTYLFSEYDSEWYQLDNGNFIRKHIWKDYTDLMINKNQAIKNTIGYDYNSNFPNYSVMIKGPHQIFFVGEIAIKANLPIEESIKNNYLEWGEH